MNHGSYVSGVGRQCSGVQVKDRSDEGFGMAFVGRSRQFSARFCGNNRFREVPRFRAGTRTRHRSRGRLRGSSSGAIGGQEFSLIRTRKWQPRRQAMRQR